jgi:YVTN family beta-propeller protein
MVDAYFGDDCGSSFTGKIWVVDTATNSIKTTIPLSANGSTLSVAVSPSGDRVYAINNANGDVLTIDTASNTVINTLTLSLAAYLAVSPDGAKLYVPGGSDVSVIDTAANTVIKTIPVGSVAQGAAFTPDGKKAYVANKGDGTVSVIDVASGTVSKTVTVGSNPFYVAVTPDGSKVYVANTNTSGTVSVIDTATDTLKTGPGYPISVGNDPESIAVTPDGSKVYVVNVGGNSVSVINTSTDAVSTTIASVSDGGPAGIAFTPDGSKAYVPASAGHTVSVITVATHSVAKISGFGTSGSVDSPIALGKFIQPASIPMTSTYTAPQGRLTLTSNTPVMAADAVNQTSVYYAPYQGNIVAIYDGANMQSYALSGQLTMALNTSNQTAGNIYDLFLFINSSAVTIGAGPAWTNSTTRSTAASANRRSVGQRKRRHAH